MRTGPKVPADVSKQDHERPLHPFGELPPLRGGSDSTSFRSPRQLPSLPRRAGDWVDRPGRGQAFDLDLDVSKQDQERPLHPFGELPPLCGGSDSTSFRSPRQLPSLPRCAGEATAGLFPYNEDTEFDVVEFNVQLGETGGYESPNQANDYDDDPRLGHT